MGPFQFLRNGFLIERDAKTLQTCHKLLFYHDLFIMAGILLASSIELILPTVFQNLLGLSVDYLVNSWMDKICHK